MRPAFALVLGIFIVLMGATWFRHTDVGDAQLYQVIARQMLRSGDWFSLEYLGQPFFDHLPFGLWPIAAAQALDERLVIPLHALFSVITVVLVGLLAHRLMKSPLDGLGVSGGLSASTPSTASTAASFSALTAMFVLGTSQFYFFQTSYPTLDPLLLMLTTASTIPLLTGSGRRSDFLIAAILGALAVAVKGPFGLLPLCGALGARVLVDRSWRHLGFGAITIAFAIAPVAVFLALRADWYQGYGEGQLLASATGTRTDGGAGFTLALRFISDRFWPWLPLVFVGLAAATGKLPALTPQDETVRACRKLAIACLLVVFALSLPQRKIWHHTLVVYPLLSTLIGVALGPWLAARLQPKTLIRGLTVLAICCVLAVAAGLEKLLMARPCVLATDFSEELRLVPPRAQLPVMAVGPEWDMLSALAFERDVEPKRLERWEDAAGQVALATDEMWASAPPAWQLLKQARGWVIATRNKDIDRPPEAD